LLSGAAMPIEPLRQQGERALRFVSHLQIPAPRLEMFRWYGGVISGPKVAFVGTPPATAR
jgi:hypothetical protein